MTHHPAPQPATGSANPAAQPDSKGHRGRRLTLLGVLLLGLSVLGSCAMVKFTSRPARRAPPRLVPTVEVQTVEPSAETLVVSAMGTVVPAREVQIFAQVTGEIMGVHPDFVEGGFIAKGETIVTIDPRDYELAVLRMEARVETARNNLRIEEGQQAIARREWELLGADTEASELERELATRQPQLRNLRALLATAEADLATARLALERTQVRAPFDAIVLRADARAGDLARSQTSLGQLCATDVFWVRATVPMDRLRWMDVPGPGAGPGSEVTVSGTLGEARRGRVLRLLGDLEPNGRMARILVEVRDPLHLESGEHHGPLLIGEFVRIEIEGRTLDNVSRIPRDALRGGRFIWLVDEEGHLRIRSVEPVWTTSEIALIRDGFQPGDRLVVSSLGTPVEGMSLRIAGEAPARDEVGGERAQP